MTAPTTQENNDTGARLQQGPRETTEDHGRPRETTRPRGLPQSASPRYPRRPLQASLFGELTNHCAEETGGACAKAEVLS